jgi:Spy/CpxP family protein refolding chaperone
LKPARRSGKKESIVRKTTVILIVAAALTVVAVPLTWAARHDGAGHQGRHFGMGRLARLAELKGELGLTDQQTAELREIALSVRAENAADRELVKSNLHRIATILVADPEATEEARAILNEQQAIEQRLKANVLEGVSEALEVLTPEQRAKLADRLARHQPAL